MLEDIAYRAIGMLKTAYAEKEKGNEKGAGKIYKAVAKLYFEAYKESKVGGSPNSEYLRGAQRWNLEANALLGNLRPPLQERLEEVPAFTPEPIKETIDLTAVKGLKDTKERILTTVAMRIQNLLEKPDGVLLYGPPGTGKTLLARGTAGECSKALADKGYEVYFFNIDRSELQSHLFGVTEKNLKNVFETAKKYASKPNSISLVFIDELHGLVSSSGTEKTELGERIAGTFYTLLDGLAGKGNVLPMAATNYPTKLPAPLLRSGRYGKAILVPPPDLEALTAMFESYPREFSAFSFKLNARYLAEKASAKNLSGADLKGVFENVVVQKMRGLRDATAGERSLAEVIEDVKVKQIELKSMPITTEEFEVMLSGTRSSLPLWYAEMAEELANAPLAVIDYFRELDRLVNPHKYAADAKAQLADTPAGKVPIQDSLQEEILKKRSEIEKKR